MIHGTTPCPCALQKCTHTLPRLLQLQKKWWTGLDSPSWPWSALCAYFRKIRINWVFLFPSCSTLDQFWAAALLQTEKEWIFGSFWGLDSPRLQTLPRGLGHVRLLLLGERGHLWRSTNTRVRVTKNCHIWGVVGGDSDLRSVGIEKESWWLR